MGIVGQARSDDQRWWAYDRSGDVCGSSPLNRSVGVGPRIQSWTRRRAERSGNSFDKVTPARLTVVVVLTFLIGVYGGYFTAAQWILMDCSPTKPPALMASAWPFRLHHRERAFH